MSRAGRASHSLRVLVVALAILPVALAAVVTRAVADPLPSATLPLQSNAYISWRFAGDNVVGLQASKSGSDLMGQFTAFSVKDPKQLWSAQQSLGREEVATSSSYSLNRGTLECYIGTGPLSCVDYSTGTVKWTLPCNQIGYVNTSRNRILPGHRLLTFGTKKCDPKDSFDALKEPRVSLIDTETGRIVWSHDTKSLEYDTKLGYWARVARWQGQNIKPEKNLQFMFFLGTPTRLFDDEDPDDAQRVVMAGEKLEILNLADGSFVYQSKDKPGILRGSANGLLFFRKDDDMTAYRGMTGEVAWKYDLKRNGGRVYTADDLAAEGYFTPEGMNDIMISESDVVSRVTTETGKALWTVKRGGMSWGCAPQVFFTKKADQVTAYDWTTGAKRWEAKTVEHQRIVSAGGDYLLAVGGDKLREDGTPESPYKIACVNAKTGQVLWTKKDVNGKKIYDLDMMPGGLVRMKSGENTMVVRLADGAVADTDQPAAAPAGDEPVSDDAVIVSVLEKGIQARSPSGKLLWERKGEHGHLPADQPRNGLAIWAANDGTVEVIGAKDGQTRWSGKVDSNPNVVTSPDWSCMLVQNRAKKEVTFVQLAP